MRTGHFAPTVPNELDWEVGKRDDATEEPPCDGTAGFRIDIVLNVKGSFDPGGKYRLIGTSRLNLGRFGARRSGTSANGR